MLVTDKLPAGAITSDTAPAPSIKSSTVTAYSSASSVAVNGKNVAFDAYTIGGNNFFKLRDVAMALNGSGKQFDVSWDGINSAINLISGKSYTIADGELATGSSGNKSASSSTAKLFIDGKEVNLTAYSIGGNNYYKLRDLGAALNFPKFRSFRHPC